MIANLECGRWAARFNDVVLFSMAINVSFERIAQRILNW